MSISVTRKNSTALGPLFLTFATLTLDTSYPLTATGGYTLDRTQFQGTKLIDVVISSASGGYVASYKDGILHIWRIGALDGNAASAAPLTEVTNGVDLSAVTVEVVVVTLGGNPTT